MGSGSHICLGNMLEQLSQSRWDVSVVIDCACPYGESKGGKRNEEIVLSYVLVVTFRKSRHSYTTPYRREVCSYMLAFGTTYFDQGLFR